MTPATRIRSHVPDKMVMRATRWREHGDALPGTARRQLAGRSFRNTPKVERTSSFFGEGAEEVGVFLYGERGAHRSELVKRQMDTRGRRRS